MKPTTKFQKYLVNEINLCINELSDTQKKYFIKKTHKKPAVRLKSNKTTCLHCSNEWFYTDKKENVKCNKCESNLKVIDSKKRTFKEESITQIITTIKDIQVIRNFKMYAYFKKGEQARYRFEEVSRLFLDVKGNFEVIGKYKVSYFTEHYQGSLELRYKERIATIHNLHADCIYPKMKVLKEIKRNGFKTSFHGIKPFTLFLSLLTESKAETIFKAGYYDFFEEIYLEHNAKISLTKINKFWSSIKIALKNNYKIKDVGFWFDYLVLLKKENKDLRNTYFVCPKDLHSQHQTILKALLNREAKEDEEKGRAKEELYQLEKSKYFSLLFRDVDLIIEPLKTINDFKIEGKELEHCVFTNDYISRKNSLLLSAKMDGNRIETVEVSLNKFKVLQARGNNNHNTKYHDRIVSLVENNMDNIKKIALNMKVA